MDHGPMSHEADATAALHEWWAARCLDAGVVCL